MTPRYTETWYGQTRVRVYHRRPHVLTQLPCGHIVRARPHDTPDYEIRARKLGYPDGAAMNAEHDLLHVARHASAIPAEVGALEENAVFSLVQLANALRRAGLLA